MPLVLAFAFSILLLVSTAAQAEMAYRALRELNGPFELPVTNSGTVCRGHAWFIKPDTLLLIKHEAFTKRSSDYGGGYELRLEDPSNYKVTLGLTCTPEADLEQNLTKVPLEERGLFLRLEA
jgi:hypothetical protein